MSVQSLTQNQIMQLRPQAIELFDHMRRVMSASSREIFLDIGMTSATLASRVCELMKVGVKFYRQRRVHPTTGRRYTRYVLQGNDPQAMFPAFTRADRSADRASA